MSDGGSVAVGGGIVGTVVDRVAGGMVSVVAGGVAFEGECWGRDGVVAGGDAFEGVVVEELRLVWPVRSMRHGAGGEGEQERDGGGVGEGEDGGLK